MVDSSIQIDIKWNLYKWALIILMLDSLHAWFFFGIKSQFTIPILFIFISTLIYYLKSDLFSFNKKSILIFIILYLLARIGGTRGNLNAYLGMLITSFNIVTFIALNNDYKVLFLKSFTKFFAILIGISLIGWIIYMLGFNMSHTNLSYGYIEQKNDAQYFFQNYYFFLREESNRLSELIAPRFSSFFLEPGYFGIVLVILIYLNNFNFKDKYNLILFLALVFTFSLAGWLLFLFVYVAHAIRNNANRVRTIILLLCAISLFYSFFSSYKGGNNILNENIISRVKYEESRGTISGYNRTDEKFDKWFKSDFLQSSNILLGVEDVRSIFGTANVGWKVYWANFGLLGLALYLLFLYYPVKLNKNYSSLIFFFLYIFIFARGHYIIYYSAFPILYLCGFALSRKTTEESLRDLIIA